MCRLILVILLLLLFAAAAAIVYLPWWGSLLLLVVVIAAIKPVGGWLFMRLILAPFKLKSAVLKGADLQVHGVEATSAPAPDEYTEPDVEEDEVAVPAAERAWYWVDLTITPKLAAGAKFTHWEPGDLALVNRDAPVPTLRNEGEGIEEVGTIDEVLIWTGSEFGPDEEGKYEGPQRVRLLAGMDPNVDVAKLRYYLEYVGEVRFPGTVDAG